MTHPVRRPMRCDAEMNRARILAVARQALAQDPDLALKPLAKLAEVGSGTVYRHFPTREVLLLAVYQSEVEALLDTAALLGRHDPAAALRLWLERLAAHGRTGSAASQAMRVALQSQGPYSARARAAVDELLAAARKAGRLRADITSGEVLLLMSYVWNTGGEPGHEPVGSRVLDVVMDGLCAGPAPALVCRKHT
ncbi:TetR family transcriptional regulator [Streptomyces tendae]|uniref:TetR/AcrR family transcriptional regulator n=1 Tax=Streptomyces tendae TaxID=1932 RepID=UPI001679E372|nr:TetR/AcrR family transcriptional regulator [Streptomyces tendae]GHB13384.1 TetR family transcriptional regulator [Streptomyces tendae]